MPPQKPLRVALIGHSSRSDNLGVGALTVSEVVILRAIAQDIGRAIEITLLEWDDPRTPYVTGPDIRSVGMKGRFIVSPNGFWREVRRADLVIDIGGGDSFTDIYGGRRLMWMFVMKFLTHLARKPLVMAPQTIGPFSKPVSKFLARLTMRLCALVASRDQMSTAAAKNMGISTNLIEASDVALLLPYDPAPPRAAGGPVRVGLNVSGLLMGGGYTGRNEFGLTMDYPALIRSIITHFLSLGTEVHLVAHVLPQDRSHTHGEDDYGASKALLAEFPAAVLAPAFKTPSEAKTYIATLDFFMGARMHACIAAFSAGVPVVPMAYSRKFAGLFGSLGYDKTVDCTSETAQAIMAKITVAFDERETCRIEIGQAYMLGRDKLEQYEQALRSVVLGNPKP
jgi:polysaccharide pyruvyl transferase WcaK-like protein